MRCLNLKDFWDKEDSLAQELYSIASLMYSGNFQLLFNKFIFAWQVNDKDRVGKIYNSNGNEVIPDDIVSVSPLIIAETNKIECYLILDKGTKEIIDKNLDKKRHLKLLEGCIPMGIMSGIFDSDNVDLDAKDIFNAILKSNAKYTCKVIKESGDIESATIDLENSSNLGGGVVRYKGNSYLIVTDKDNFINNCVCTA